MNMSIVPSTRAWLSLMLVAGCTVIDPRIGADSRTGYVSEIYSARELDANLPSCLRMLSQTERNTGTYVEIMIPHGRRREYLSAKVPADLAVQLHDEVEFAPKHCSPGVVPEVKQILKHSG